jgi:hypothetical protein
MNQFDIRIPGFKGSGVRVTNKVISMKTSITKSLLTSLYQREEINPSLAKRGTGRFFNNDALPMNSLVKLITGILDLLNPLSQLISIRAGDIQLDLCGR